jgi:uncharacterized protein with von Willebrand factor type A (vWA) domain
MKSPLIPQGAGKGDKPRPVDKQTYDRNFDAIFRSKDRRKDQVGTPPELSGGSETAPAENAGATRTTRNRYNRVTGPDGQTVFVRAC